ncbi:PIN domain-containing protein [Gordonia amarae]|uniref:PIN domain-containing protein n=2 Tax=Gordonia amarae TaxID=36821 RepID=G7GRY6_9ACTN|nr:PIN domain-containing protein [Gordonia amarae]MCS3879510.1 hypothetical protein [Gordonia amarae]QHN17983.1 PIN domain-containing protein [Gordonia amarae]QHN22503.1 PIN domain-containing protein [Gordonia amarae]QHN31368.1 PIN domain-containing protein [Gordonia amarae]QHN40114.1 PIN domain-containing protein [Gordonia amarae]
MLRAVLDACTLVPSLQRDFLLQIASEGAYAPLWGTGILTELDYTLAKYLERQGISDNTERRSHLFTQMRRAFPGAEVDAPKDRVYDYRLRDAEDGHVAHAALVGEADAIVTDDSRAGFTSAPALIAADIESLRPNHFRADPQGCVRALVAISSRRSNPPQSPEQILDLLVARYAMTDLATVLRPLVAEVSS